MSATRDNQYVRIANACGRPVFIADAKFGQRRFSYDAAGQLTCVTSGLGGKTHFTYTETGQVDMYRI